MLELEDERSRLNKFFSRELPPFENSLGQAHIFKHVIQKNMMLRMVFQRL